MSTALIAHKRITTTVAKAKALRVYIEPLISRAKEDTTHNRRQVFRHLQDKSSVTTLFEEIAEKVNDRPGGYTRVIRLGRRSGDGADLAMIELVDYNDVRPEGADGGRKRRTRRSGRRRGRGKAVEATPEVKKEAADLPEDETIAEAIDQPEEELEQATDLSADEQEITDTTESVDTPEAPPAEETTSQQEEVVKTPSEDVTEIQEDVPGEVVEEAEPPEETVEKEKPKAKKSGDKKAQEESSEEPTEEDKE